MIRSYEDIDTKYNESVSALPKIDTIPIFINNFVVYKMVFFCTCEALESGRLKRLLLWNLSVKDHWPKVQWCSEYGE